MEVKLDKRYPVAASVEQCWAVLSDIRAVAACMPGAQITEQIDATHFKGAVKSKVGPAVMSFGGDIELQHLDPATYTLQMLGKGADKSGSSASMQLSAHLEPADSAASSVLVGVATISVSGKLAQFGSRLLVPVSDAMLAQFADNFRAAAAAAAVALEQTAPVVEEPAAAAPALPAAAAAVAQPPASLFDSSADRDGRATMPGDFVDTMPPAALAPPPRPPRQARPVADPAQVKELNALALMWTVFKGWLAGLFGKRP